MSWISTVGGVWQSAARVLTRKREKAERMRMERKDIFTRASIERKKRILSFTVKYGYGRYIPGLIRLERSSGLQLRSTVLSLADCRWHLILFDAQERIGGT